MPGQTPPEPRATASFSDETGRFVLRLSGELDLSTIQEVRSAADELIDDAPESVVVDLAEVTFMDSSGIALLLRIAGRVPRTELRNPSPMVRRVLEMTGLTEMLPIVE